MRRLTLTSAAESDYAEALVWYVEQSQQAAERFDSEFERVLKMIANTAERFPRCDERHHYCQLQRFPYRVIYRIRDDEVIVMTLSHSSRDPSFWSGR